MAYDFSWRIEKVLSLWKGVLNIIPNCALFYPLVEYVGKPFVDLWSDHDSREDLFWGGISEMLQDVNIKQWLSRESLVCIGDLQDVGFLNTFL